MWVVTHRAGNDLKTARAALASGADLVEADVRLHRRVPEVRHHKAFGKYLWDHPWELLRRSRTTVPTLADLVAAVDSGRVLLDLKGVDRRPLRATATCLYSGDVSAASTSPKCRYT